MYWRDEYFALLGYLGGQVLLDEDYPTFKSQRLKDNIKWFAESRQRVLPYLSEEEIRHLSSSTKSRLQYEANEAHRAAKRWGLICMATGTGKTKTAIDAIRGLLSMKPNAKILVIVPTTKLKNKTWKEEFQEWGMENAWRDNVEAICYKSAHKLFGNHYDLMIMDEIHNITENNSVVFKNNQIDACIALTATPPENRVKRILLDIYRVNLVYEITLDEAVDLGVVAPYEITIVYTTLDAKKKVINAGTKAKPFKVTEASNYAYFAKIENSDDPIMMKKVDKMFYIKRMGFIYNLPSKIEAAQYILNNVIPSDMRTLIFAGNTKQAEVLCPHFYHSKTTDKDYNLFVSQQIPRLACVEALNEGDNLPAVDCAFIEQLNSKSLDLVQRIGRIIRFRVGHVGKIIILCVKGTVDAKWVANAIQRLDATKVKTVEFKDILEGKENLNL